jgi:hypothetical protein
MDASTFDGHLVLARTRAGQREALDGCLPLTALQRRLLLLVNGFTALDAWLPRLPASDLVGAEVGELLERGLVVEVGVVRRDHELRLLTDLA